MTKTLAEMTSTEESAAAAYEKQTKENSIDKAAKDQWRLRLICFYNTPLRLSSYGVYVLARFSKIMLYFGGGNLLVSTEPTYHP